MNLLIDCDYIVYKCCAAAETEIDFGDDVILVTSLFTEAYRCVQRELDKIKKDFPFAEDILLFFTSPNNFRKKILPEYKGHRNRKKPCGFNNSSYGFHIKESSIFFQSIIFRGIHDFYVIL